MLAKFARTDRALLEEEFRTEGFGKWLSRSNENAGSKPAREGSIYFLASAARRFSLPAKAALVAEDMRSINKIPFR